MSITIYLSSLDLTLRREWTSNTGSIIGSTSRIHVGEKAVGRMRGLCGYVLDNSWPAALRLRSGDSRLQSVRSMDAETMANQAVRMLRPVDRGCCIQRFGTSNTLNEASLWKSSFSSGKDIAVGFRMFSGFNLVPESVSVSDLAFSGLRGSRPCGTSPCTSSYLTWALEGILEA